MRSKFLDIYEKFEETNIPERTVQSKAWFYKELRNLKGISEKKILTDGELVRRNRILYGRMFMYGYDPKHAETLEYYDTFPLIILMQGAKNGFYGINLHYLEPRFRALFFDILVDFNIKDEIFDDNTRFRKLTYERLNTNRLARAFKPCFKHYLRGRIKTNLIMVPPKYWEMALFLPTDNFQKASRQTVWRDSRDQFRKS